MHEHVVLGSDEDWAEICPLGAGLRGLRLAGVDVVPQTDNACDPRIYWGSVLAPWPNRLGGPWTFGGQEHPVAVTEPDRGTALHGLASDRSWQLVEGDRTDAAAAVLETHLIDERLYPYDVRLAVRYTVGAGRLDVTLLATNAGAADAPLGLGLHPYFRLGAVDDCTLAVRSDAVMVTDARSLPTGLAEPEPGLGVGIPLAGRQLDHAYRIAPGEGPAVTLRGPAGVLTVEMDPLWCWVMVFTGDLPGVDRSAVAIEPMTCPIDALRSGTDLLVLPPGGQQRATVTVRTAPPSDRSR